MKVGDSFAVPCANADGQATTKDRIRSAATYFGRQNAGYVFLVRAIEEGGKLTVRCWRIAKKES